MKYLVYFYVDSIPLTREVLAGESSLGGSESACLGLAEALAARGHDVHIFATKLAADAVGSWRGVEWHGADQLQPVLQFAPPDVFVSLRMPQVFSLRIDARLNILWAEDLLTDPSVVGQLAQVDHVAYVSEFHRKQWEGLQPIVAPLGWVTRNGINPDDLPDLDAIEKGQHRFIYISRPERGLEPLLALWPRIRAALPDAELQICRYRSMYDGEGSAVAQLMTHYDALTAQAQKTAGGITVLGHLNKRQLYQAIAGARLMLYPGVQEFAETNGIAWTEAQACGTPIIGSWKGAAPETIAADAGVLLDGDALSPEYQDAFVAHVLRLAEDDVAWSAMREAGLAHALPRCAHATIAAEWDAQITRWFQERYDANKIGVLRQLLWWDNHAAALQVAEAIVAQIPDPPSTEVVEAIRAKQLCERVLAQEEQTPEDYARFATQDVVHETKTNTRLQRAATLIASETPARVLDVACGNGSMALLLAQQLPEAEIHGWDSSAGVLALAGEAARAQGVAGRVSFHQGNWDTIRGVYDAVFCGEFIEHLERPWELLDRLEQHCAPDGQIVLTCPCGPFAELLAPGTPRLRGHVHAFTAQDLVHMGEHKRDWRWWYLPAGQTPRGTSVGYWCFAYRPRGGPAQPLDYTQQIVTTRPYQRLTASMIVKDEAVWLRRCLLSLDGVVDRVVIYDSGSTDGSQDLARALGAEVVEGPWPQHFGVARNRALDLVEGHSEWVLWIDADEDVQQAHHLRKYLTGAGPFVGYVLYQQHVMTDQPSFSDKPVRLFQTGRGVQFYGAVHEQPEDAPDQGIFPALEIPDCKLVHLGYLTDQVRREKMTRRNFALLKQELASEAPRQLAYVLAMRDLCHLAQFAREAAGGALTPDARRHLLQAVALYRASFADPAHRYHALARPFYEVALEGLGQGWQVEWAFAAAPHKLQGRVKPERFRVLSVDEMTREIDARLAQWTTQLRGPSIDCEPWVVRNGAGGWGLPPVEAALMEARG